MLSRLVQSQAYVDGWNAREAYQESHRNQNNPYRKRGGKNMTDWAKGWMDCCRKINQERENG